MGLFLTFVFIFTVIAATILPDQTMAFPVIKNDKSEKMTALSKAPLLKQHFLNLTPMHLFLSESRVAQLVEKDDVKGLAAFVKTTLRQSKATRMGKCIAMLGSSSICNNRIGFYIWAQLLACDVISGTSDG